MLIQAVFEGIQACSGNYFVWQLIPFYNDSVSKAVLLQIAVNRWLANLFAMTSGGGGGWRLEEVSVANIIVARHNLKYLNYVSAESSVG